MDCKLDRIAQIQDMPRVVLRKLLKRDRCPNCGHTYYWENTKPGQCDGCGYPNADA